MYYNKCERFPSEKYLTNLTNMRTDNMYSVAAGIAFEWYASGSNESFYQSVLIHIRLHNHIV